MSRVALDYVLAMTIVVLLLTAGAFLQDYLEQKMTAEDKMTRALWTVAITVLVIVAVIGLLAYKAFA